MNEAELEQYSNGLKNAARLHHLYSEADEVFFHYRFIEKLYIACTGAEDLTRTDKSFDARLGDAGAEIAPHRHRPLRPDPPYGRSAASSAAAGPRHPQGPELFPLRPAPGGFGSHRFSLRRTDQTRYQARSHTTRPAHRGKTGEPGPLPGGPPRIDAGVPGCLSATASG